MLPFRRDLLERARSAVVVVTLIVALPAGRLMGQGRGGPLQSPTGAGAFAIGAIGVTTTTGPLENGGGATVEVTVGYHLARPLPVPLAIAITAGAHGYLGEDCVIQLPESPTAFSPCAPSVPANHYVGVLAGVDRRRRHTSFTLLFGSAAIRTYPRGMFEPAGGTVFAVTAHADAAVRIPATRVSLALAAHTLVAPNFPQGTATLVGYMVGLRLQ